MNLHRFYVGRVHDKWGNLELNHELWVNDEKLVYLWVRVLHLKTGGQLVLFNDETERIYELDQIEQPHSVHLKLVAEQTRQLPKKHIYLLWALQNNNEAIVKKGTELGCTNFIPIITDNGEKSGFDIGKVKNIIVEAAEKSGRADIPNIRESITLEEAVAEYQALPLLVCEKGIQQNTPDIADKVGVLIGPEAGWSDREKRLLKEANPEFIKVTGNCTGIEAAAEAVSKLLQ